jgi:hypothetical protein
VTVWVLWFAVPCSNRQPRQPLQLHLVPTKFELGLVAILNSSAFGMWPNPTLLCCSVAFMRSSSGNAQLELGRQLCEGSNGMVVEGKCDGTPAVIKLLGPDRHGLAAFQRELHAYSQLQAVQGSAVPRLLAAGRLPGGVHFIASQLIKGQPLAALPSITVPVAAAASRALASVHTACPSLCHGDVRLENVMLLAEQQGHSSSSSSSIQPSCVVIDFGQSWFGASAAHQLQEREWLQRLLQARARDAT